MKSSIPMQRPWRINQNSTSQSSNKPTYYDRILILSSLFSKHSLLGLLKMIHQFIKFLAKRFCEALQRAPPQYKRRQIIFAKLNPFVPSNGTLGFIKLQDITSMTVTKQELQDTKAPMVMTPLSLVLARFPKASFLQHLLEPKIERASHGSLTVRVSQVM